MGRLKLFGEPQGGGTDDHSALTNLGYAQSGHTGFVPSQGEALIEILRLTQNIIRDSDANDRIQLSPTNPYITFMGMARFANSIAVGGYPTPGATTLLRVQPEENYPLSAGIFRAIQGYPDVSIPTGYTPTAARGLEFRAGAMGASGGGIGELSAIRAFPYLASFYGTAAAVNGIIIPAFMIVGGTPTVSTFFGITIEGFNLPAVVNAYGLKIGDMTGTAGFTRLLELGPTTPYLRLVGGGDPPADKSNLYLKFGSTLYRVVKTGSSMTLEAA